MKTSRFALCAFLSTVIWTGVPVAASKAPVGMVIQAEGETTLSRGGETRSIRVADLLYPSDVLTVGGGLAFLFCPETKIYNATAGSTLKLDDDQVRTERGGAPSVREARRCSLPRVALGDESLERSGAIRVRDAGIPEVVLYLGGPISSSHPLFEWRPVEAASGYRLSLLSDSGDPVWSHESDHSPAEFPGDKPGLEEGFYEWRVEALAEGGRTIAEGKARIEVHPNPEMAALARENTLESAVELENQGFHAEAAAIYRKISETMPEDERFVRHLAWLYDQAGLLSAAQSETAPGS